MLQKYARISAGTSSQSVLAGTLFQCKCKTTSGMGHNNVPSNDINSYLLCHSDGIYSTLVFMEINELYLVPGHKTNAQKKAFCWSSLPNATPTVKMPKPLPPKCGRRATSTNRQVLTAHRHRLSHDRRTGLTVEARDRQTLHNAPYTFHHGGLKKDQYCSRSVVVTGQQPSNSTTHRVAKMLRR